jgi:hypothetical protein
MSTYTRTHVCVHIHVIKQAASYRQREGLTILYFDGSQTILSFLFQYEMSNILVHLTKDSIEHSAA